ncbi:hypothetical protein DFR86_01110 [Acidianus sulfidivorans JP7]|uniref:Uncharacterized protein n=1 Tax=Acidianus sulfidivorans JP7 TaxID=619593 RepID=A0A2U9IJR7_9CREN|nr:hypothetical protein [Acidianus sulfidivorans]AWR96277.1 hypothetical protein DFR86_01110 [Acidianus sulfidivorans JP7]
MNKEGFIIFFLILTTIAPGILATSRLSLYVSLPSIILGFVIAYLTYLLVNVKWDNQGLYYYAKEVHPVVGNVFLFSWLSSYYLYVAYTAIYIPYYLFNINSKILGITISLVAITAAVAGTLLDFVYLFPLIGISQLLLILPIGWKLSLIPTSSLSISSILTSSLLTICITLSTFIKANQRKYSFFIPLAFFISIIPLVYSSFLQYDEIAIYGEAIGNFGLIFAEFYMIRNLLSSIKFKRIVTPLGIIAILLVLIGNLVNYSTFYNTLIVPSLSLLYLSLFSSFLSIFKFFHKSILTQVLGLISLFLFSYGEYNILITSKGYLFLEAISSIIIVIILSIALRINKQRKEKYKNF